MTDWASETEAKFVEAALDLAGEMGFSAAMLDRASRQVGLSRAETELLLPHGLADLAALVTRHHDDKAMAALAGVDPASLKIRERIHTAVMARHDAAFVDEAATHRLVWFLALPQNLPLAFRLLWGSADRIWRWAGDTATDENHYSKRAILSGVLITTLIVRLTQDREACERELAARIQNVMDFEKWKAGIKPGKAMIEFAQALGKLRYR
jgi:ubiquinone biosynthesis protein COQ9